MNSFQQILEKKRNQDAFVSFGAMSGREKLNLNSDAAVFPAHDRAVISNGVTFGTGKIAQLHSVTQGEGQVGQDKKSPVADIQQDARIGLVIHR